MGRKRKMEMVNNSSFLNESSNSSQSHLNIIQRCAANDRERTRMRVLSKAFVKLKTSLPWVPSDTKLSKLDTLKLATSYIAYLTKILEDDDLNAINLTQQPSLDPTRSMTPSSETTKTRHNTATNYPGNSVPVSVSSSSNPHNGFSWLFPLNNNPDGCSYSESNSNRSMSAPDLNANQDNHYGMYAADPNT